MGDDYFTTSNICHALLSLAALTSLAQTVMGEDTLDNMLLKGGRGIVRYPIVQPPVVRPPLVRPPLFPINFGLNYPEN